MASNAGLRCNSHDLQALGCIQIDIRRAVARVVAFAGTAGQYAGVKTKVFPVAPEGMVVATQLSCEFHIRVAEGLQGRQGGINVVRDSERRRTSRHREP